jgi:hypothetical protein
MHLDGPDSKKSSEPKPKSRKSHKPLPLDSHLPDFPKPLSVKKPSEPSLPQENNYKMKESKSSEKKRVAKDSAKQSSVI